MKTVQSNKGFTLIELLIVIAVLGILAVAVLSAINPIEQINRSRDTGSRSDSEQLIGAIDRYYTTKGYYPWQTEPDDATIEQTWIAVDEAWLDTGGVELVIDKLSESGTGEVKSSFADRITDTDYNTLYVVHNNDESGSTYVCFAPRSNQFKSDADDRCVAGMPDDFTGTACDQPVDGTCGNDGDCSCLP